MKPRTGVGALAAVLLLDLSGVLAVGIAARRAGTNEHRRSMAAASAVGLGSWLPAAVTVARTAVAVRRGRRRPPTARALVWLGFAANTAGTAAVAMASPRASAGTGAATAIGIGGALASAAYLTLLRRVSTPRGSSWPAGTTASGPGSPGARAG